MVNTPVFRCFRKVAKVTISFIMSLRPSVCIEQLSSHWKDFHEIWYLRIFLKSFEKIQVSLTLILLTWRIWWAPNSASRWQMGFNSAFKGDTEVTCVKLISLRQWGLVSLYNERLKWVTSYPLLVYFTRVLYGLLSLSLFLNILSLICDQFSGFGGLGVACWPLVPKFAGSNPAEAVGFLRAKKSSARLPSEGK